MLRRGNDGPDEIQIEKRISAETRGKAKDAGETVGKAASKARVPLVAGGAAIAGAAGNLALAASKQGKKSALASRRTAGAAHRWRSFCRA
jgi:hypothetical protein